MDNAVQIVIALLAGVGAGSGVMAQLTIIHLNRTNKTIDERINLLCDRVYGESWNPERQRARKAGR